MQLPVWHCMPRDARKAPSCIMQLADTICARDLPVWKMERLEKRCAAHDGEAEGGSWRSMSSRGWKLALHGKQRGNAGTL